MARPRLLPIMILYLSPIQNYYLLRHAALPRADLRQRLRRSLIAELARSRPDHFSHRFRDTRNSRQIALIDLPCPKYARRIFAIVSTISIPTSASMNLKASVNPLPPGSLSDADRPEDGVLIPRRFTLKNAHELLAIFWLAFRVRRAALANTKYGIDLFNYFWSG